jgi:hypothetical protein
VRRPRAQARQEAEGSPDARPTAKMVPMLRLVRIWTWDVGERPVDMDGDRRLLTPILETILEGGLWKQFRKFPPDVIERLLPSLNVPRETRRLLEIWVEEAAARGA